MEARFNWRTSRGTASDRLLSPAAAVGPVDFTPYTIAIIIAIASEIVVPATLLLQMGLPYDTPGGFFLLKFHPGTFIALITLATFYIKHPERRAELMSFRGPWHLIYAVIVVLFLQAVGPEKSGSASFIENFMPAAAICLILATATERCRRVTAYWMVGLVALNIAIAIGESIVGTRLIPSAEAVLEVPGEFRGSGLTDHPLTGASMSFIGLFLFLSMRPKITYLLPGLLFTYAGFLSFGGRTALVLSVVLLIVWGIAVGFTKIKNGRFRLNDGLFTVVVLVVLPMFFMILLTSTNLGIRLVNHLYWDDSAQTRNIQWRILGMMSLPQLLFGMNTDQLTDYIWQLGLLFPFNDVENFWLLIFCNVGAVTFIFFLFGFFSFLWWLWQQGTPGGRMLLVGMIIVLTSSNSLGRKSNMLTILAPAVMCTRNFLRREDELMITQTSMASAASIENRLHEIAVAPPVADKRPNRVTALQPPRLRSTPG